MDEGEGESEEEEEEEDEDEEEVVVLGDVCFAAIGAGAAFVGWGGLRGGHCGEDGGHLLGLQVGGGWLEGHGRNLAARWADLVGSGGRGRRGTAVSAFRVWLDWAPAMCEGVHVGIRGAEQFAWAAFGGRGG